MAFCLPKEFSDKFTQSLKDGQIQPEKLAAMSSDERRAFFSDIVGAEHAKDVNALFESKLLLKDYKRGLVSWAKKVAGMTEQTRRDLVARIEKMDHILNPDEERAFLSDLAAQKLGATVTLDEARTISEKAAEVQSLQAKWDKGAADAALKANPLDRNAGWPSEQDRLTYGLTAQKYHEYLNHLLGRDYNPIAEFKAKPIRTVASALKGWLAAFDNSFFGRQGLKMLFTNTSTWTSAFTKSWADMGKDLAGIDAMAGIRADILSRPNAMNGKYRAGKYAIGVDFEEALPSTLPERIPLLGRFYKATETAFNGSALRLRADYADKIIALAEKSGVDTLDPKQAKGLGYLVNSMTGRGNIPGMSVEVADTVNAAFFSARFVKSNFDTLTMHRLGRGFPEGPVRSFATKQAAKNLVQIVGGIAAIMYTANKLWPGSVESDPRSADFGKIKIGNTHIDVTGGMGSLVTLAARIALSSTKSTTTGKVNQLNTGKFGSQTTLDVVNSFWEGKLSPLAGTLRDILRGQVFGGQPATPSNLLQNLTIPLPAQTAHDLLTTPDAAPVVAGMLLDGLGFSTNTYATKK